VITRRQFLMGCAGTVAALSGLSFLSEYKHLDEILKSIPILLYHRVGSETDALTITTERFQRDMATLSEDGYNTLSLDQLRQHMQGNPNEPLPKKPIMITFDDGYLDNYTNAFPILQKYSMKASFYIITGMVGQNDRLTASQIREMETAGMTFGSHTITHRPLAELSTKETQTELTKSKLDLEEILGKNVDFIAYPCGSYTAETIKIAHEAGYRGGFSVRPGFAMLTNTMTIRRIPVFHYDRSISYVLLRKGLLPDILS
jgi:peptidoglycan/xylan/chitin deacetylase (PgdA/CDA1 family)